MDNYYESAEFYRDMIEVMLRDTERMERMGFVPEDEIANAKAKIKELGE